MDDSRFRFSFDEDGPDTEKVVLRDEVDDLRIDKLRRRLTLISFLIPVLFGAVIALEYFDIKTLFGKNFTSGNTEVQTLSKTLDSRYSSLSIRQAKLESVFEEKLSQLEKSTIALKIQIQKTEKLVDSKFGSIKTDDKSIEDKIAKIDSSLTPIRKEIDKLAADIKTVDQKLTGDVRKLSVDMKKFSTEAAKLSADLQKLTAGMADLNIEFDRTRKELSEQTSAKLDKKMFELALKHEERMMQQKMEALQKSLFEKLEGINQKLNDIETRQSLSSSILPKVTEPQTSDEPVPPPNPKTVSRPGGFTEQEIR